jgi:hypothetical protein
MIVIDFGNKHTAIYDGSYTITKKTTIKLTPNNKVTIGDRRELKGVIYDFVILLGLKYKDTNFHELTKFSPHSFQ